MIEWGQEVDLTKKLIEKLDVKEYFEWLNVLPRKKLLNLYQKSNGVIDQLILKSIG